jgi:putative FmdB family regulatory protein
MPTYDYQCRACGHTFDELQSFSAPPLTKCPACKKNKLERLFGGGGAIIFKGSGFYETDYRRPPDKAAADAPAESKTETKAETKTEAKPAAEAAPKPAAKSESKGGAKKKD